MKNASNTLGFRVAELGKCTAQTVISGVELYWGYILIHYVTCPYSFLKILIYCSMFLYTSMFDILTINDVSDERYENDWDLIKAFY